MFESGKVLIQTPTHFVWLSNDSTTRVTLTEISGGQWCVEVFGDGIRLNPPPVRGKDAAVQLAILMTTGWEQFARGRQ